MSDYKKVTLSSGKNIHVFDNLFSYADRNHWFTIIKGCMFSPNGRDNPLIEYKGDYNLYSQWMPEDLKHFGILEHKSASPVNELVKNQVLTQVRVNLSTLNDTNRFHVDTTGNPGLTILYYANLNWEIEWGGYTLFANDDCDDVEYTSIYKPGRVIVFDGSIPHCIAAPTIIAPSYRFSLAIQYKQSNEQ